MRNLFGSKKLRTFFFVLLAILAAGFYIRSRLGTPRSPFPDTGAAFRSLTPGKSSKDETINRLGEPVSTTADSLEYLSTNPNLYHKITLENETVVFIREQVSINDNKTVGDINNEYGEPPYILYGPESVNGFNLYVYPEKGVSYIGNPDTGGVLEIWYFKPMSLDEFRSKWASNYSTRPNPPSGNY